MVQLRNHLLVKYDLVFKKIKTRLNLVVLLSQRLLVRQQLLVGGRLLLRLDLELFDNSSELFDYVVTQIYFVLLLYHLSVLLRRSLQHCFSNTLAVH